MERHLREVIRACASALPEIRLKMYFKPKEVQDAGTLMATVWPEPFSYENTDDEKKLTKEFPFSEEGKLAAVDWLNEQYESRKEEWDAAKHTDWSSLRK